MNRAYKLMWSSISGSWVVASELAKGSKKSAGKSFRLVVLAAAALAGGVAHAVPAANALPSGESVTFGSASFDRSVSNQLTVNQSTSKLVTNWNSFNVGSNGKVVFAQPDATSIALNRVTGGSASEIFGQVTANGQLVLVNPNGITFGAGSQVSAASIIGSVLDINDSDFNAGTLLFSRGAATGTIDNQGSLTATAGSVSLLAPTVKNSGKITATAGNASLINADAVDLTAIDPVISTASGITGLIQQSGNITATQVSSVGGKILLTGDTSQTASQVQLAGTLAAGQTLVNGRSIVVNGDLNVNGASNVLGFTSTDGYSLTNGAAVNLNGASSGFSVNGTAYTVIRDVNQLQAMNSNLAGKYVLAGNIDASDTVSWNSGAGFVPVGNTSNNFTGILDGLGHRVNALTINRPGTQYVGLIGSAINATLQNIGLSNVNISGNYYVGALAGQLQASTTASILNSFSSGSVSSQESQTGGLVGRIAANSGVVQILNSYSTAQVSAVNTAGNEVGGLVGYSAASGSGRTYIANSYASGNVSAYNAVGGLVGRSDAAGTATSLIENSYASGSVADNGCCSGGLVGYIQADTNRLEIRNTYASGAVSGLDAIPGSHGGLIGYNGGANVHDNYWNTDTTGQLVAIGVDNNSASSVRLVGLTDAQSKLASSYSNWGSNIDAQGGTGATWRIYDGQTGPLLRSFLKSLSISATNVTKTYDGTSYSPGTPGYSADTAYDSSKLLGTVTLGGSALNARNAGTYNIDISGLYSGQDGYDLSVSGGTLTINKRVLTITATDASKEYDGKLTSAGKPVVVGRQRGDAIVGLTQSYLDKNAGTGKTINVDAGFTIRDGNGGNNYDVVILNSNAGVITPKALTISTVANTKVYDGGLTSANKPVVTGLVTGDRVTSLFQQYETKTVGDNKKLIIKAGYVVDDGNGGNNYTVTEQGSTNGVITLH